MQNEPEIKKTSQNPEKNKLNTEVIPASKIKNVSFLHGKHGKCFFPKEEDKINQPTGDSGGSTFDDSPCYSENSSEKSLKEVSDFIRLNPDLKGILTTIYYSLTIINGIEKIKHYHINLIFLTSLIETTMKPKDVESPEIFLQNQLYSVLHCFYLLSENGLWTSFISNNKGDREYNEENYQVMSKGDPMYVNIEESYMQIFRKKEEKNHYLNMSRVNG
jgi:hypothetical protein